MSVASRRVAAARRAKSRLAQLFAGCDWVIGVGIVPDARRGLSLRVDVRPGPESERAALPELFEGMPVHVVRIESREPR